MSNTGATSTHPPEPEPDGGGSGLIRSSGIVAIGTTLSRVTGLLRTLLTYGAFGVLGVGYAYNLANNTPNMIYDLLLGGILSATLVPILVANRERRDDAGTNAVLTVATVALFVITLLAVVLAPVIVGAYTQLSAFGSSKPSAESQALAVLFMRLFAPQILFYGLSTLGTALLNTHRRFAAAAFAPVLNNVWMIALLLQVRVLVENKSVEQVTDDLGLVLLIGLGTTAGILAMTLVLWPAMARAGLHWHWNFDLDDPAVRRLARMSTWTIGYVVANQVTLFVVLGLAGDKVAVWNYAYQFFQLPYGVFTVSIMTTFTPELATLVEQGRRDELVRRVLQGLRLIFLVTLPSTVLLALLARPLVWALFVQLTGRSNLDEVTLIATSIAAFAWGLIGFSVYLYVLRCFYAYKDTQTPFFINVAECALTLVLAFVISSGWGWGVEGLAWAWSISYLAFAAIAFVVLRRRTGAFGVRVAAATTAPVARMVVAAAAMAVVVAIISHLLPDSGEGAWATLIVGSGAGVAVYVGLCHVLRVGEIRELPRMLLRR